MGITHAFTSAKSDGGDSSLVKPSDWNAAHVISGVGLILLEQHTASSSATLNFTTAISATYDEYLVEFIGILPATTGTNLYARVSTDGGSNWDSSAASYVGITMQNTGVTNFSATQATIATNVGGGGTYTVFGVYGSMRMYPSVSRPWYVGEFGFLTNAPARVISFLSGDYEPASFNAIQFFFSSGNITSGTIRIYGVPK